MTGNRKPFARITAGIADELRALVGSAYVTGDQDALQLYGQDETEDLVFPPEVVVKPGTVQDISGIFAIATREHIAVTPRGGGTGLSGGALPVLGQPGCAYPLDNGFHDPWRGGQVKNMIGWTSPVLFVVFQLTTYGRVGCGVGEITGEIG